MDPHFKASYAHGVQLFVCYFRSRDRLFDSHSAGIVAELAKKEVACKKLDIQ